MKQAVFLLSHDMNQKQLSEKHEVVGNSVPDDLKGVTKEVKDRNS